MSPSLGVEVAAPGAPIIHLASECAGYEATQDEDPSKHCYGQQSVGKTLHQLSMAARPFAVIA